MNSRLNPTAVDFFLQLESRVWAALAAGDAAADERLLADTFLGVYSSGFSGKHEHVAQLKLGPTVRSFALTQARIQDLGEGVVVLSYLATWSRCAADSSAEQERTYISSIWREVEGVWRNVFSQDTQCDA